MIEVVGLGALLAGLAIGSAHAGMITNFSSRPVFDAAVGRTTLENFLSTNHFPITSGILNDQTNEAGIRPGDIQSGVTYSTPVAPGFFFNIDSGAGFDGGFLDSLRLSGERALTITFDEPVAAFGFDTNGLMGTDFDITINFAPLEGDGPPAFMQNFIVDSTGDLDFKFFGFQSDEVDIASVVIQGNGNPSLNFALDNFAFGGAAVPEPVCLSLVVLLAGIGFARSRARRRA